MCGHGLYKTRNALKILHQILKYAKYSCIHTYLLINFCILGSNATFSHNNTHKYVFETLCAALLDGQWTFTFSVKDAFRAFLGNHNVRFNVVLTTYYSRSFWVFEGLMLDGWGLLDELRAY